jgi:Domain of Unknown Function with PDB structure (DUF3857)
MNKRVFFAIFWLQVVVNSSFGQSNDSLFMTETTDLDRKMMFCAFDSSANAVILEDLSAITVDAIQRLGGDRLVQYKNTRKLKILDRSAIQKWGTLEVILSNLEEMTFKATIFSPTGKIINLLTKDMFVSQLDEYYKVAKISFPELEVGSIVIYETNIFSPYRFRLKTWFFQQEIPVLKSVVNLKMPNYYNYAVIKKGILQDSILSQKVGKNGHYRFVTFNLKSLKQESYTTTIDDYRANITFQLNEYISSGGDSYKKMESWEAFSEDLWRDNQLGSFFVAKNSKKTWAAVKSTLGKDWTAEQKLTAIYDWVNKNIVWNHKFEILNRTGIIDNIYKKGIGNSGEINYVLMALFRQANIITDPIFLSTRQNGYVISNYPVIDQFNHIIIRANCDGKEIFIDGGNKFRPINTISFESMNELGIVIPEVGVPKWIKLPVEKSAVSMKVRATFDENAIFAGNVVSTSTGTLSFEAKRAFVEMSDTLGMEQALSRVNPDISTKNKIFTGKEASNQPFSEQFDFKTSQISNGDFLYFNPVLVSVFSENPFKNPKRETPVDFGFQIAENYILEVQLPIGYIIESKPTDLNLKLLKDGATFRYKIVEITTDKIQLSINLNIENVIYQLENYGDLRDFFEQIAQKYNEQIVLKKS